MERDFSENDVEEYHHPIDKIFEINRNDEFVMDLIKRNMGDLLKYTDYNYGDRHSVKRSIERNIQGFMIIRGVNGKYSIGRIILYRSGMLPGIRNIILLYGTNVKLREKLIIKLINYFRELSSHDIDQYDEIKIYADSYNNEDSYVYMDLGFRFYDASQKPNGDVLSVTYLYRESV